MVFPGALAFSCAIRHKDRESQKVADPFDASKKVEFKFVNATSDSQFRFFSSSISKKWIPLC